MKKHFFRILSCCVLLACLCALPAYAQEPKAAPPPYVPLVFRSP